MSKDKPLTIGDALDLPPMIDLVTAARYLGIGRTTAYTLAAKGALPVPVVRIGSALRVPTGPLLKILGLTPPGFPGDAPAADHTDGAVSADASPVVAAGPRGREDPPRPPLRYPAKWSVDRPRTR